LKKKKLYKWKEKEQYKVRTKKIPTLQKGLECRKIKHTMRKLRPRYAHLLDIKSGF